MVPLFVAGICPIASKLIVVFCEITYVYEHGIIKQEMTISLLYKALDQFK